MKVTFKIYENLETILKEIRQTNDRWISENRSAPQHGHNSLDLKDIEFDSWAKVDFWGEYFESSGFKNLRTIRIETAWSGFFYEISEDNDGTFVTYEGAYKGLLTQNLLPTLTPVDILCAEVESSISPAKNLKEYSIDRQKFLDFKKSIGCVINSHAHPKCVWNALN